MKWKKENVINAYLEAPKKGLQTELEGKKLYEWGEIFLELAKKGLIKRNQTNSKGNDETVYLKHVQNVVANKKNRYFLINKKNFSKKINIVLTQNLKKGIDNKNRVGPLRATQSGLLTKYEIKLLIYFILILCLVLGMIAFFISGIFTIIMGLILLFLAYTYTGGPKPYGYMGLGEIAVLIVFGPFTVLGSLYLFSIHPTYENILISLIPCLLYTSPSPRDGLLSRMPSSA